MSTITQRATVQKPRERPQPVYIARAKVNGGWQTIGAAWRFRSGEPGLSIQLNTLPINFDGRFVLLEPLPNGEAEDPADPEPATSGESERPPPRSRRRPEPAKGESDVPF